MPACPHPTHAIPIRGPKGRRTTRRRKPRDVLALWRTTEPENISAADTARMAGRIAAMEMPRERRWPAARHDNPAAAVAVAIDHLHRCTAATPLTDLVVGNLVPLAKAGNATAALVIGHALRKLARLDPSDPDLTRLARLWDRRRTGDDRARRRRPAG